MNQVKKSMNTTVNKALSVINCFTDQSYSLTLEQISNTTGIPKTTVFRMLTSLESYGYVKSLTESGKVLYSLGYTFLEKGFMVQSSLDIRNYAKSAMLELRNNLNLNVQLAIQDGLDAIYVEQCLSFRPIRLYLKVGRKAPLYSAACPRVILAFLEEDVQNKLLEQFTFEKFNDQTLSAIDEIKESLKDIYEQGYSLSYGEIIPGTIAIAVPIFYPRTSKIMAALSIIGLEEEFTESHSHYVHALNNAAAKVSENILN